ncbi:thiamine pyrophosphokinase ThiN [Desulfotignum phosphitoxidans DSM 13687]|jgi:thiamine pyrophosphokinase|uniref:Thiamine diphosphokinase n=2 Tax=Desulfotignum TaxID=115780 RepID=S0G5S3_9BACT|nr:thiamine pyrophosphokinase ThiN [Desulfotignum phosphitoxidans DSM 13687]
MNTFMNCIVIAGGRLDPARTRTWHRHIHRLLKTADLIIAADSGAGHLKKNGVLPHVIVGDLDSIDPDTLNFFKKNKVPVQPYPRRKNRTDMELCLDYAKNRGATHITMLAATGTRLDHTLANVLLLVPLADAGICVRIMDAHNEICLVKDRLELSGNPGDLVSLIPLTATVTGVTLTGLSYPLRDQTLRIGTTLGISNFFSESAAQISIKSGTLLVIRSMD